MTTNTRHVVIVGGGYAGVRLARELDTDADVTLIDLKEAFFHRVASLRASADTNWTYAPFIPYDSLLANGRVVRNKAVRIDTEERQVVLATGHRVPYDVLVIATGADYEEPARFTGNTVAEAAASFRGHQRRIARARSLLVIGGGPSGVELAAELRLANAGATVTLAHSSQRLLSQNGTGRMGRRARSWLERHDVRVLLDTFVSSAGGVGTGLRDQAGHPLDADVVFWTTGTTPNTLWLRLAGRGDWLDERGHVKVDEHLRVVGRRDVFAIGDVNDVSEAKLSPSAVAQGEATAHNIRALLDHGRHGHMPRPYRPAPVRAFSVPFGPDAGTTLVPALGRDVLVLGNRATSALKGRHLAIPIMEKLLGRRREA
ncbi:MULTISPECIES: NAD(P)/FAD-dependent oxidoreductase [unclassified Streptomyces]|uniref:NAD(P)/FAD-dependent oxidoreductase n=1 Tax=unclassified Streptomyces TaxID=2593676 RepID=UPI000748C8BE|nr:MULTISPECIES: FAD-dependent oxidoreductase [unclassified Streptomyces]KUL70584.1 oxidoreductase [Streptomyces sp. NRRL WC-3604]KUL71353.1 oxidoreductase [Streptomyces sp. NRRL WC-3605]